MIEYWLVVMLHIGSDTTVLEDTRQPDLATCLVHAQEAIEHVTRTPGNFEVAASCQALKHEGDPA